jgi:hypothetical protein
MHKGLLPLLAFALATASWLPAAAQYTPMPSPSASTAPTTAPSGAVPATTTTTTTKTKTMTTTGAGQSAAQPTFDQLMSSLNRMKAEVAHVQALRTPLSTNNVHIVKVQAIAGTDTAALNNALSKNASQLGALRSALARVPLTAGTDNHQLTFAEFLTDNKMSVNQVVAADVSNGSLTAYVQ